MMQLTGIAQVLAAQGRNGDSVLLHITPKELLYLQAVAKKHGRTLTINPKTGLPEASGLADLVGPLVGIGLSIFAPELSPLFAGLISGAASGIASGNMEKGLFGGLLGGGINSIFGGIGEAGADALGQEAATNAVPAQLLAQNAGENAVTQRLADTGMLDPAGNAPVNYATLPEDQQGIYDKAFQDSYSSNNFKPIDKTDALMKGASAAFQNPLDFYKNNKTGLATAGIGALGMGAYNQTLAQQKALQDAQKTGAGSTFTGYTSPGSYRPTPTGGYPDTYDPRVLGGAGPNLGTAFSSGGLAKGGIASYRKSKKMHFAPMPDAVSEKGHHRSITQALRSLYESKASAASDLTNPDSPVSKMGIAGVNDPLLARAFRKAPPVAMAQGGRFLEGPGDGLSDSIPASIEGKQQARLADGEFVVPADAVSDMGNGSSKAGAKKLMAMVHQVRKKRHGTTKQPGPV